MKSCAHKTLTLLAPQSKKLRCRTCHLVITEEELAGGFCPECFDVKGEKRTEFEPILRADNETVRYRCEECGALIEC